MRGSEDDDDPVLAKLQSANPGVELYGMDGYGFDHEGHTQECVLPEGHRFVIVCGGVTPQLLPDAEPGVYVFTAPGLPQGGMWPQLMLVVKAERVQAVLNMAGVQTAELIRLLAGERGVQ